MKLRLVGRILVCLLSSLMAVGQQAGGNAATAAIAAVSVPRLITYSGIAKDAVGKPLSGSVGVTFAFYQDQSGGSPVWLETQNVQADAKGHFTVMLGASQSAGLPLSVFTSTDARWLGVQVQGQPEQTRVLLVSVPYALKASDAETIGGLPPSAFVMAQPAASNTPATAVTAPANSAPALVQPNLAGGGTVNFIPLWTPDGNTLGNSALFQSGSGATVKIGLGTSTPATTLDVKGAGTFRGALSLPATGVATAAAGKNSQPTKMTASAFNSGTSAAVNENFQWQAEPVNNNTSNPSGTLNLLFSSGTGQPAETGLKVSNTGVFTFAPGQIFPGAGTITSVTAGPGLSGGGTSGNITVALTGGCSGGQVLQWNGVTWLCTNVINGVTAGTDLTVGGFAGNLTLNLDTTKVPELTAANTFTANQSITGNLTATGTVTGSVVNAGSLLNLQGIPFATGSPSAGNIFLGFLAGNSTNAGQTNVGTGSYVLSSLTTGSSNVAAGWEALSADTTGSSNTASGVFALQLNTTGSLNTASGDVAMQNNTTGSNNTAFGNAALFSNTTGSSNTAIGNAAGPDAAHPSLTNSTAVGANAVVSASNALVLGGTGANAVNVGIGTATPAATLDVRGTGAFTGTVSFAPTQTFPNTLSGVTAGTDLTGGGNTGSVTLNVDTTKVVTGVIAGTDLTGGGTGGVQTLSLDTTKVPQLAAANTFTNSQTVSGNLNATGTVTGAVVSASKNFSLGGTAFAFGSFSNHNAFDGFAGNLTTTGTWNTGSGVQALASNTSGTWNTAIGANALTANTNGSDNTAIGEGTLLFNTSGNANTANGYQSLSNNTGSGNTGIGWNAIFYNGTGSNNTALGFLAGPDPSHTNLTNTTAIGSNAQVTASNALVLGSINGLNGATADALVGIGITAPTYKLHVGNFLNSFRVEGPATSGTGGLAASFGGFGDFGIDAPGAVSGRFVVKESGKVGIGTASPDNTLSVNGSADKPGGGSWGTFSDGRLKNLHGDFNAGLAEILKLRPIRYTYKAENGMGIRDSQEHVGFVAQDVQKVIPEAVSQNDKGYLLVNNDPILWTMLNAIKEQQRQIADLHAQLRKRAARQTDLEARLARLERTHQASNSVAELYQPAPQQSAHNRH